MIYTRGGDMNFSSWVVLTFIFTELQSLFAKLRRLYAQIADAVLVCPDFGPSVDDQAVSLSDDGTTIIIEPHNQTEPAL